MSSLQATLAIQTTSIKNRLKIATQMLHARLEALPSQQRLLSIQCSPQDYGQVLAGYASAMASADDFLRRTSWPALCPYVPRLPLLHQDLTYLGRNWILTPPPLPEGINPWGLRYVIEGMALGGQWILHKAPICQHPQVQDATAFFRVQGQRWPDFCAMLESELDTETAREAALWSACWIFEQFLQALEPEK